MSKREAVRRALDLEDQVSDLLQGFRFWKAGKVSEGEWTERDEQFARWVEHGP